MIASQSICDNSNNDNLHDIKNGVHKPVNNIHNDIDIIRTNNDDHGGRRNYILQESLSKTSGESCVPDLDASKNVLIYRFKFTDEFMQELHAFSKIHQYDDRHDFKEAWNSWMEEYNTLISAEQERLITLGYHGDILEKMYKSARYYFRKKTVEKKEPVKRRKYMSVSKDLLDSMDQHIRKHMFDANYQPKKGFESFCTEQQDLLREAVANLVQQGTTDTRAIQEKMKKTYKNRYYIMIAK